MMNAARIAAAPAMAALALLASTPALGQVRVPPPPPEEQARGAPDDRRLARSLAEEVRRLADDINTDLGRTREGRHASEDARELAQSIDDYRQNRREGADPISLRQAYSGLHADWQHLRAGFARPGASSPVIDRDLARIDGIEEQLAQALGLNRVPADDYDAGPDAPAGYPATRRLARAMVDRAEALALTIQDELGRDPGGAGLVADSQALARECDAWHDSLNRSTTPEVAARTFGTVDAIALRVERVIQTRPVPKRVSEAWTAFAAADDVIHRTLNVRSRHGNGVAVAVAVPGITIPVTRPVPPSPPPVIGLADALVEQTAAFVTVFGPTAGNVPEGGAILGDAQRLTAAAQAFRQNLRRGANPNALGASLRDVDILSQRLTRRVGRIAKGRTGPNIQQVSKIGAICDAIHRSLG